MGKRSGPIYEVTHAIDPAIAEAFDAWLADHASHMLQIRGILFAQVYYPEPNDDGDAVRVTQYRFASDEQLDDYLAGPAASMRTAAIDRFGDSFKVSRRVLRSAGTPAGGDQPTEQCLNCQADLIGQYCGQCGQRARSRLISLWELVSDAFGDLFELDSRLWRTLLPLLFRPGRLTRDYLEGKRARFMPPFRMYIVLSLLFFLVLLFNPRDDFGLLFEPGESAPEEAAAEAADDAEQHTHIRDEVIDELVREGIISPDEADKSAATAATADDQEDGDDGPGFTINLDNDPEECDDINIENLELPDWLARRLTPARVKVACERLNADSGKAFLQKLLDSIPPALFFLLPLMALVLKFLYPLSRRYYVEHLLFVVHYHAFFFLVLTLMVLLGRVGVRLAVPGALTGVAIFAMSTYVPVYLYKAMRLVYQQGHLATIAKFLALTVAYFAGLIAIFAVTTLFAIFSI